MARRAWFLPLLAVSSLLLAGAIIARPVFSRAGTYYLDNPAHIAEVISLAHAGANGWSDIALCGFPLATLHSPPWYGLLAWLTTLGSPAHIPYLALLGFAFVAPSLALLYVMARRMLLWAALLLAYGLLAFRGAAIGSMAALGGMFTFYLAAAAFILLADRLARPERSWLDVAVVAALTACIGLSHTYVTLAVMLLAAIHGGFLLATGAAGIRTLIRDGLGFALGGLASAHYLLLVVASGASSYAGVENLSATSVLRRLIAGFGVPHTAPTALGRLLENKTLYTDSLLQIALIALGLLAARHAFRVRHADRFAAVGLTLAVILMGLLLCVLPGTTIRLLGPQSFRLTYIAKLGLLCAAAPLVAAYARRPLGTRGFVSVCVLCVASGFWWQRNVTGVMPSSREVEELETFWTKVREARRPEWGRVYVQDTFDTPGTGNLSSSHAPALTSANTGVQQLGALYGVMPFATRDWTHAERGRLFGVDPSAAGGLDPVVDGMRITNSTHLILVDASLARRVAADDRFRSLLSHGRYSLLERLGAVSEPVTAGAGVRLLAAHSGGSGEFEISYRAEERGGQLHLREAYSPLWRIEPALGRLQADAVGLMTLVDLPPGAHTLRLRFVLPRFPFWLSMSGLCAILVLGLLGSRAGAAKRTFTGIELESSSSAR